MVSASGPVRIASRGSQLALWQTRWVKDALLQAHPGLEVQVEVIRTTGDRILDVPLAKIGDRGLFTKEIDEALLDGRADLAVHSLKDVPTRLPDGVELAAISEREDPRDVVIGRPGGAGSLGELPPGARVGTSALRRRAQLRRLRADLEVHDLRGNLNTRLARLDAGDCDAVILAAAGIVRLGWADRIGEKLPIEQWLPAVGQGALAIVARAGDPHLPGLLRSLNHPATAACTTAERGFLRSLEGGCQVPIAAFASLDGGTLHLDGLVADLDGAHYLRATAAGPPEDAEALGVRLARTLIDRGAADVLRGVRAASEAPGIPEP
jgi:hydroxymethylbilane synthase